MRTVSRFDELVARLSYTGDPANSAVVFVETAIDLVPDYVSVNTNGSIDTTTFLLSTSNGAVSFTASDRTGATDAFDNEYVYRLTPAGTNGALTEARFLKNVLSADALALYSQPPSYVSRSNTLDRASTMGEKHYTSGVFGFPSPALALPADGRRSYATVISGRYVKAFSGGRSTDTAIAGQPSVVVNFANRTIDLSMALSTCPGVRCSNALVIGSYTSQARFDANSSQFSGALMQDGRVLGTIRGQLYGPQASEIGIAFSLSLEEGADNARLIGTLTGSM